MKRLSFRFCRRVLLILAILFPIVYLCGGLFFALAGAHGENVFATEETSIVDYKTVNFNQLLINGDFSDGTYSWAGSASTTISVSNGICSVRQQSNTTLSGLTTTLSFDIGHIYYSSCYVLNNGADDFPCAIGQSYSYGGIHTIVPVGTLTKVSARWQCINNVGNYVYFCVGNRYANNILFTYDVSNVCLFDLTAMYGEGNEPTVEDFLLDFPLPYYDYTLSELITLPIYGIPNEQNLLFFHLFGQRNFINQLGKDVLNGNAYGFPPFRDMFNWFNDSVMHIESDDDLGVFGLGYAYYAMNVVAVYELVVLVLMVFALPLRITDKFMGEHL